MPANFRPRYGLTDNVVVVKGMSAANTAADLSAATLNTDVWLMFTAGADGGYLRNIRLKPQPANNVVATVARVWISTAGTLSGAALMLEVELAAFTASNSLASADVIIPIEMGLPASATVYLTFGTDPGTGNYSSVADGHNY
jgi:hypothetical protein